MKQTYCGVILAFTLCLTCAAQSNRSEFEERFRSMVWHTDDDLNADAPSRVPSKEDRLLEMARQAGVSRSEVQALLLRLVDEGMVACGNEEDARKRGIAESALSVLGNLADATALDQIVQIASMAPREFLIDAMRAAIRTATREQPSELPTIVHDLLQKTAGDHVFGLLHDVLKANMPDDVDARNQRLKIIMGLFKESLRNPKYEDRIYLDTVIEEYDPEFRQSEERRRILLELSNSPNPLVKRYAEEKLGTLLGAQGTANASPAVAGQTKSSAGSGLEKTSESKARRDELQTEKPAVRLWTWSLGAAVMAILALTALWIKSR